MRLCLTLWLFSLATPPASRKSRLQRGVEAPSLSQAPHEERQGEMDHRLNLQGEWAGQPAGQPADL